MPRLAVPAAVAAATSVKTTPAVKSARRVAVEPTATTGESASAHATAASYASVCGETTVADESASAAIETASANEAPAAKSATSKASSAKTASTEAPAIAKPRPSTDEEATGEPLWPIEAVGSAVIRVIPVVAVGADRPTIAVASNTDHDLGLRRSSSGKQENTKQSQISEIP